MISQHSLKVPFSLSLLFLLLLSHDVFFEKKKKKKNAEKKNPSNNKLQIQFFKRGPAYKKGGPDPNKGSNQQ